MATPVAVAGKNARLLIGATAIVTEEWSAEMEDSAPEVSNTEGAGYADFISGLITLTVNVKGFFDIGNYPFASPPNITPGATLSSVTLNRNTTPTAIFTITSALVTQVRVATQVKDKIMLDWTMKGKGSFTLATS